MTQNIGSRADVVLELKVTDFEPGYLGQLGLYLFIELPEATHAVRSNRPTVAPKSSARAGIRRYGYSAISSTQRHREARLAKDSAELCAAFR